MGRQTHKTDRQPELEELESKVGQLKEQASRVRRDVQKLIDTRHEKRRAVVNRLRCTGCGLCEQVCPAHAIRVTYLAHVDPNRCTGCGVCAENCPQGALSLRRR